MTPEQRAELARLADEATPGQWSATGPLVDLGEHGEVLIDAIIDANARFIAAANPDAVRALLRDLEAAEARASALATKLRLTEAELSDVTNCELDADSARDAAIQRAEAAEREASENRYGWDCAVEAAKAAEGTANHWRQTADLFQEANGILNAERDALRSQVAALQSRPLERQVVEALDAQARLIAERDALRERYARAVEALRGFLNQHEQSEAYRARGDTYITGRTAVLINADRARAAIAEHDRTREGKG